MDSRKPSREDLLYTRAPYYDFLILVMNIKMHNIRNKRLMRLSNQP